MKYAAVLQKHYWDPAGFYVLETDQSWTRIWFLGDGVVRIRTSFTGSFPEESLSLVWTAWEDHYDMLLSAERCGTQPLKPDVRDLDGAQIQLSCESVAITVRTSPYSLACGALGKAPSFRDVPGRAYTCTNGQALHSFCLDESSFYGFGEKTGSLEKTGTSMRMSNKDACGYDPIRTDPLYKHVPWFIKLRQDGEEACGIYYNTASDCQFDIGREYNGYWPRMGQFSCQEAEIDLFFLYGPTMRDVVKGFCRLTGYPAMLPQYALGYLGSTMFYSELPEGCDEAIQDFVKKAQKEQIPCTDFQLSSGYTTDANGKRNVFSWNREKFPDPGKFIQTMQQLGVEVTPNIKPALLTTNPLYDTFRQAGAFLETKAGAPYLTQFWGGKGSFVDFTNPEARSLWIRQLKQTLLSYGIHSLWNDNNEFDIADEDALCCNEGRFSAAYQKRAILPMLMNLAGKQALKEVYPNLRPYQVTRSGNAGICRYAQTWTGDNFTSWDSLRYNIATMLGCGLSGLSLTGSDIGGFAGPAPDAELFLRWIWCGVFLPRFTIHSANNDNTVTEPWMFPEHMDTVRKAFQLRQRLMPYLYSLHVHAHKTGEPILRPMVYEFPSDPQVRYEDVDFLLGDGILAACVVEKGATTRSVYLPKEETFYAFHTRKRYSGGQTVTVDAPIDNTPLFQRGGSILPLGGPKAIELWICPDKECSVTLYEDDGITMDYQKEEGYLASTFHAKVKKNNVTLFATRKGSFCASKPIHYHIQCTDKAPMAILWNGLTMRQYLDEEKFETAEIGWHYCHSTKICIVKHKNGRDLNAMEIQYDLFDLIRMDP